MIVDVNVHLSRWPFRRLPCDELPRLIEKLQASGVAQAWAGSFDGIFHKDVAGANSRLAADCRKAPPGMLLPFGTVNPMQPDWRDDVRRCAEEHRMPGIRLYPGYHGYGLDAPVLAELFTLAEERGLIVQLVVRMEDIRMQHPLMPVPDVDVAPLPKLVAEHPELRLVILDALKTVAGKTLDTAVAAGQVYVEISMLEGVEGISNLLRQIPVDRVLFGSHLPLFLVESALLKLEESELSTEQVDAITHKNAERLIGVA